MSASVSELIGEIIRPSWRLHSTLAAAPVTRATTGALIGAILAPPWATPTPRADPVPVPSPPAP